MEDSDRAQNLRRIFSLMDAYEDAVQSGVVVPFRLTKRREAPGDGNASRSHPTPREENRRKPGSRKRKK